MDPDTPSFDLAAILSRLADLETRQVELQRINAELQATVTAQQEALQTAHEQIALLRKRLFSAKRERFQASPDQRLLFETAPVEPPPPVAGLTHEWWARG